MNEENGDKGGLKYAELAAENKEEHLAAIESDLGRLYAARFWFDGASPAMIKNINQNWKNYWNLTVPTG